MSAAALSAERIALWTRMLEKLADDDPAPVTAGELRALLAHRQPASVQTIRDAYGSLADENDTLDEREFCVLLWRACERRLGAIAPGEGEGNAP